MILLDDRGMDHAANQDSLSNLLVKQGLSVLLVDIPGIGEMGPGYMRGDAYIDNVSYNQWFAGILTGKSLVGLRAEDIVRITHFIKTNLQGVESISAIASGTTGSGLLHAALFDSSIQKVCLKESYLGFADIALSIDYVPAFIPSIVAGAIEEYDLQDLMAGIYPRKLLIVNPLSGNGTLADRKKADDLLSFPNKVYEQNANFSYTCENDQIQVIEHILKWLRIAN